MLKDNDIVKLGLLVVFGTAVLICQGCTSMGKPALDALDTKTFQMEIMAKITGYAEIYPGLQLPDRCTLENRITTRDYLLQVFNDMGYEGLRHSYSDDGENVYAVLKADAPSEEYVVLGAHYDSARENCPGGNDNGTGVAAVLAAAQSLKQVENRSRNFIFILFDQEERGMRGSRAFAQKLQDEKTIVNSVHTIDQMGWDADGDRAIELEIPYEGAVELYQQAADALNNPLEIYVTQERGSDHSAFRRLGYSAVGITEEYHHDDTTPHIHRTTDTYETIDFDYLESTTQLVIKAMEMLAREPAREKGIQHGHSPSYL